MLLILDHMAKKLRCSIHPVTRQSVNFEMILEMMYLDRWMELDYTGSGADLFI